MIISFLMFTVVLALRTLLPSRQSCRVSRQTRLNSYLSTDSLNYIQNELRISDIINEFLPDVHPVSNEKYLARCPFHDDRNPSLSINDIKGNYRCYACGASGNAIHFVRANQNLNFRDAVSKIMELFPPDCSVEGSLIEGVTPLHSQKERLRNLQPMDKRLIKSNNSSRKKVEVHHYQPEPSIISAIMSAADTYFQTKLDKDPNSIKVHAHIRSRRLSKETVSDFHLGYAPFPALNRSMPSLASRFVVNGVENAARAAPSLTAYLLYKGFTLEDLVAVGFTIIPLSNSSLPLSSSSSSSSSSTKSRESSIHIPHGDTGSTKNVRDSDEGNNNNTSNYYDRFRDRLMVAIKDHKGQIVAFGGRAMMPSASFTPTTSQSYSSLHLSSLATEMDIDDDIDVDSYFSLNDIGDGQENVSHEDDLVNTVDTTNSKIKASHRAPAKYVNSPTSSLFIKGSMLYGFDVARASIAASRRALIVEGYFDVISLHDGGVKNAVACMGTAISLEQLKLAAEASWDAQILPSAVATTELSTTSDIISRGEVNGDSIGHDGNINDNHDLNEIVLLLDADKAGRNAVHRVCTQVIMQRRQSSLKALQNQFDEVQPLNLNLIDNLRVASIDCLLDPLNMARLEQLCFSRQSNPCNTGKGNEMDAVSGIKQEQEQEQYQTVESVRLQLQQLGHLKDASDLCVSIRSIAQSSPQSQSLILTPAAVMEIIVKSAIDWRLWMINWIIGNTSSPTTGVISISHLGSGRVTMTSSLAKFIHKCTSDFNDTKTLKLDQTSLVTYAVKRAASIEGTSELISEAELLASVKALQSLSINKKRVQTSIAENLRATSILSPSVMTTDSSVKKAWKRFSPQPEAMKATSTSDNKKSNKSITNTTTSNHDASSRFSH